MNGGQALQVVSISNHTYKLNKETIAEILLTPEIRDRKIVIVSVAGAFRKGKSFLLGFFLRYLNAQYVKKDITNWLGKEDDQLEGFSWRGGPERDTTGILMWSEIFLHDDIAIVILDTQGVFDGKSTAKDCSVIFALSTLISSVQIYNISGQIQETDIQHLQLFTEYGKMAMKEGEHKPFQRLQFLIRDWSGSEYTYEYGAEGGKKMLNKYLETTEGQHSELRSVRENIYSSFSELECFLMPHPSLYVAQRKEFMGQLKHMNDEFKHHLKDLVHSILSPENLRLKEINGEQSKVSDWFYLLNKYFDVLTSDKVPSPSTIMTATAEAQNLASISSVKDYFTNTLQACLTNEPVYKDIDFENKLESLKSECFRMFDSKKKMGGVKYSKNFRIELAEYIKNESKFFRNRNNEKNLKFVAECKVNNTAAIIEAQKHYEDAMTELFVDHQFYNQDNLNSQHQRFLVQSMNILNNKKTDGDDSFNEFKNTLELNIGNQFMKFKIRNNENEKITQNVEEGLCIKASHNSTDLYCKKMLNTIYGHFLDELELYKKHQEFEKEATEKFDNTEEIKENQFFNCYKKNLEENIKHEYTNFKYLNTTKLSKQKADIELHNLTAMNNAIQYYETEGLKFMKTTNEITVEKLKEFHDENKPEAVEEYKDNANHSNNFSICLKQLNDSIDAQYDRAIAMLTNAKLREVHIIKEVPVCNIL